jgi:hypothetical protein
MFNQIASFFIGIATAVSSFLGFTPSVGSITTINGSDRLTDSRTVINDNFTDLDTRKLETTATTLPASFLASSLTSVGTITSGTWSGTAIAVAKGGTGTTSPTQYHTMVGGGSSGLVAVNPGTSGQFLTSNGASAYPTYQSASVDESQAYDWTGIQTHSALSTFNGGLTSTATTTLACSSITGNACSFNGVNTQLPSANSYGFLANDGSGVYSLWSNKLWATTSPAVYTGSATGDFFTTTISANTLGTANVIKGKLFGTWNTQSSAETTIVLDYGGTDCATASGMTPSASTDITYATTIEFEILEAGTNSQRCVITVLGNETDAKVAGDGNTLGGHGTGTASETQSSSQSLTVHFTQNSGGQTWTLNGGYIEVIR